MADKWEQLKVSEDVYEMFSLRGFPIAAMVSRKKGKLDLAVDNTLISLDKLKESNIVSKDQLRSLGEALIFVSTL